MADFNRRLIWTGRGLRDLNATTIEAFLPPTASKPFCAGKTLTTDLVHPRGECAAITSNVVRTALSFVTIRRAMEK
jgi:hypothetical protein